MGNMVSFAIREDYVDSLSGITWRDLSGSVHLSPVEPRFFEDHRSTIKQHAGVNIIDGIAVTHYHHQSEGENIYISSQLLYSPDLLFRADVEGKGKDDFIAHAKKTSKYLLGIYQKFSVRKSKKKEKTLSSSTPTRMFVFGYLTDSTSSIDREESVLARILDAIKTNDFTNIPYEIKHVATIDPGNCVIIKMEGNCFHVSNPFPESNFTGLRKAHKSFLGHPNHQGYRNQMNLAFSQDFLASHGYQLKEIRNELENRP